MSEWITKDSGEREEYKSGMVRELQQGKPNFGLTMPLDLPYSEQMYTRLASLMARGAEKYSVRNWEKANSDTEYQRFKDSSFRHFMQWYCNEVDEDHAAAIFFNVMAAEYTKWKINNDS